MTGWRLLIGVAIGAALLLITGGPHALRAASKLVVVDDDLDEADLIYVLNGKFAARVDLAAHLYHHGMAAQVRVAHTRDISRRWRGREDIPLSERMAIMIVDRGVPQSVLGIVPFEGGVVNTRDEAMALRKYLEQRPARRIIVVSTDHHTGRAQRIFRQELNGLGVQVLMAAAPDLRGFTADDWWASAAGRRTYSAELLKHLGALIRLDRFIRI